jgi:glycosyltransferase involved in cell wall biosynthesis
LASLPRVLSPLLGSDLHLLLITPFFPPSAASGSFRALGFAKHLPKFGWKVTVVASGPRPWESVDGHLVKQIPWETDVHYVDFPLDRLRQFWPRALQKLKIKGYTDVWNAQALQECQSIIRASRPDAVITTGPPHNVHLIGRQLQAKYDLPWVADFRDPWCSWGSETPYASNNFLLERHWERSVFNSADLIVANTGNSAEMFRSVFPYAANRIEAVPNGYDPISPEARKYSNIESGPFILLHTGSVYAGRNPRPIADALREIDKANCLQGKRAILRMVGHCLDESLKADIESRGLNSWVEFVKPVSYAAALQEMLAASVLVLLDSPGRRIGVPAKLYEYIGTGRPILALARDDSDTAIILRQCGVSHAIVPDWNNIMGIQIAVAQLLSDRTDSTVETPAIENLTREAQAGRLSKLLEKTLQSCHAYVDKSKKGFNGLSVC